MKRVSTYLLVVIATLVTSSCDQLKMDWDLPSGYVYASVMDASGNSGNGVNQDDVYFMMDDETSFYISENKSSINYNNLEVGSRVLVGITLYDSEIFQYDYKAELYNVIDVILGECATVTDEQESEAIADDKLSFISSSATLTYGYLNIYNYYSTDNPDGVKFYLVENEITDVGLDEEYDDYLYLELRFDSGSTGGEESTCYSYVSFDMEYFRDKLEGKDGIFLRAKTVNYDKFNILIDSDDLF